MGLPFDFGVAVGDADGGLFVAAGDQLGRFVAAVIDDGFVQATECRAGIGGDVFEPEGLDDVHHEIRAGPAGGEDIDGSRGISFRHRHGGNRWLRGRWSSGLRRRDGAPARDESGNAAGGCALQESSAIDHVLF
jgi:hypothetical protein